MPKTIKIKSAFRIEAHFCCFMGFCGVCMFGYLSKWWVNVLLFCLTRPKTVRQGNNAN